MRQFDLMLVPYDVQAHGEMPDLDVTEWHWLVQVRLHDHSATYDLDQMDAWCRQQWGTLHNKYEIHYLGWIFQQHDHAVQFMLTWS